MRPKRGELTLHGAHPDVRAVLERCEELREETGGYFDHPVPAGSSGRRTGDIVLQPGDLDPSGFVKGWAVDRAALILEDAGARTYSINAGGDIRVRGCPAPLLYWRVGLQ